MHQPECNLPLKCRIQTPINVRSQTRKELEWGGLKIASARVDVDALLICAGVVAEGQFLLYSLSNSFHKDKSIIRLKWRANDKQFCIDIWINLHFNICGARQSRSTLCSLFFLPLNDSLIFTTDCKQPLSIRAELNAKYKLTMTRVATADSFFF